MRQTEASLKDVQKLLKRVAKDDPSYIATLDHTLGALIVLSPLVLGPAFLPLLAVLGPKRQLMDILQDAVGRIRGRKTDKGWERFDHLATAHALLVHLAVAEALTEAVAELAPVVHGPGATALDLTYLRLEGDTGAPPAPAGGERSRAAPSVGDELIALPHPTAVYERGGQAKTVARVFDLCSDAFAVQVRASDQHAEAALQPGMDEVLAAVPERLRKSYTGLYLAKAADFPELRIWRDLAIAEEAAEDMEAVDRRFTEVLDAVDGIDTGFARLEELVRTAPWMQGGAEAAGVVEDLRDAARADVDKPIVDEGVELAATGEGLAFPTRAEAFIAQAFRVVVQEAGVAMPFELEETWTELAEHQDLAGFLLRHLTSPYSAAAPLLVLGHPGSGKSLLTRMLCSAVVGPEHPCIRVELRDVNALDDVQDLLEAAVRATTGHREPWTKLYGSFAHPPTLVFDGFDELLQASRETQRGFLQKIALFQTREASLRRPVRVVVTSRLSLIDQASIPPGTTVVRLSEFDDDRQDAWVECWNEANDLYFRTRGVAPFSFDGIAPELRAMARQPLLLLMIALFDSTANELRSAGALDATLLYEKLVRAFIRREWSKGDGVEGFGSTPPAQQEEAVDGEMARLSMLAIGMFNRRSLSISRRELLEDLAALDEGSSPVGRTGPMKLSDADLLLGRFFFVHEASSGEDQHGVDEHARLEFLHTTFGEFLACRFIVSHLVRACLRYASLASDPDLAADAARALGPGRRFPAPWYRALSYAPIHGRPVIAGMAHAWLGHALAARGEDPERFREAFLTLLQSELCDVLESEVGSRGLAVEPKTLPWSASRIVGEAIYLAILVSIAAVCGGAPGLVLSRPTAAAAHLPAGYLTSWAPVWRDWLRRVEAGLLPDEVEALTATVEVDQTGSDLRLTRTAIRSVGDEWTTRSRLADHAAAARAGFAAIGMGRAAKVDPNRLVRHAVQGGVTPPDALWAAQLAPLAPQLISVKQRNTLLARILAPTVATRVFNTAGTLSRWVRSHYLPASIERHHLEDLATWWYMEGDVLLSPAERVDPVLPVVDWIIGRRAAGVEVIQLDLPPRWLLSGPAALAPGPVRGVPSLQPVPRSIRSRPLASRVPAWRTSPVDRRAADIALARARAEDMSDRWPELVAELHWSALAAGRPVADEDLVRPVRAAAGGLMCPWLPGRLLILAARSGDRDRGRLLAELLASLGLFRTGGRLAAEGTPDRRLDEALTLAQAAAWARSSLGSL